MEPIITIENLDFKEIKNLNIKIKKNSFLTILGSSKSGAFLLSDLICGIIKNDAINISSDIKIIGVFSQEETPFVSNNVLDELNISSVKFNEKAEERIKSIIKIFKIDSITNKKINELNFSEKQILIIICSILMNPDVLVFDNSILNIDPYYKDIVLNGLKQVNKIYKITIINITNDSEQSLYGDEIAIINDGKLVVHNKKMKLIIDENIFLNNNLKVPFMVDLSIKLKYYGLVGNIILQKEKLVKEIWNQTE